MSNSLDLIKDTIKFEQTNSVPVIPQIFGNSAILTGHSIYGLSSDSEIQAQSQIEALNFFGRRLLYSRIFDASIETEAMGSEFEYHTDNYPDVNRYFLNREKFKQSNFNFEEYPKYNSRENMPQVLNALKM